MEKSLKAITALFSTKAAKLIAIVVLAGLMATSSAAVFTQYYASTTATVATAEVTMVAGGDASSSLASVSVAGGTATVGFTMYENSPTYYTDLLQIHNGGSGDHTITKITVSDVTDSSSQLGTISVYYCDSSTADPATTNIDSFDITDTTGGTVFSGTRTIGAGADDYIEIVATAVDSATPTATVTFTITIEWN